MQNITSSLPEQPWVYIFKKGKKVLYVWKAKNLKNRVNSYFRKWIWAWKEDMINIADNFEYYLSSSEEEALILEEKLVKKYNPWYNSLLKWDNAYTYIRISKEDFPKIEFTRFKDKPWFYIWPKPWKQDLKKTLQLLRYIFKFRTCSTTRYKKWKVCSDFTLGLCKGYCTDPGVDLKKEYDKNIKIIKDFFNWKTKWVSKLILEKINQAIKDENFEYAKNLKNIYYQIDRISEKQTIELSESINWYFIKTRKEKNLYFMIYMKFQDWKLVDLVKLKGSENNFIVNMINEGLIDEYETLWENFYFWKKKT